VQGIRSLQNFVVAQCQFDLLEEAIEMHLERPISSDVTFYIDHKTAVVFNGFQLRSSDYTYRDWQWGEQ
jgi:hypothetical protein